MVTTPQFPSHPITAAEYLAFEEQQEERDEFRDGEIVAIVGRRFIDG